MTYPGKILIIKLGSIGDVVNSLPLVNALKAGMPEMELGWLIEPKSYPIVEGHRSVDRFIIHQRSGRISGAGDALKEIREFKPDLVIDLQRILRSSFFTIFSGCRRRLGFDRRRCKEYSWLSTNEKISPGDPKVHMVYQYLEFAGYLGLADPEINFYLPISDRDREEAAKLLLQTKTGKGVISLNIGAAKPSNRWPEEQWAELTALIIDRTDRAVVLTGGSEDSGRGSLITSLVGNRERLLDFTGRTSLKQLGGLFLSADTVVTGDTGPMHIASALGGRTIGLFGPADPGRTGPFNHLDLVVRSRVSCAPCGRRNCPDLKCMKAISAEEVYRKIFSGD
ncbi:MAG TPA: glycosyltransferase family 9 protein [Proteobacteria bacterium]|nr:glycosyltransferase family 9 protein [Pseudomonadota bacterium]